MDQDDIAAALVAAGIATEAQADIFREFIGAAEATLARAASGMAGLSPGSDHDSGNDARGA